MTPVQVSRQCGTRLSPNSMARPPRTATSANRTTLITPLTPQQRAWLNLVQPLTIVEGFALLSVPSSFVQNEIERHLRAPITDALSRRLGQQIQLGVRIAPPDEDADGGPSRQRMPSPKPKRPLRSRSPPPNSTTGTIATRWPARPNTAWPNYFTERAHHADSVSHERRQPQPPLYLRHVRHRRLQSVRACRRAGDRRSTRPRLQPALHLGGVGPRQDPSAACRRQLCPAALPGHAGQVRIDRRVHQRLHQLAARRPQGRVQAQLSRRRRPAGR